jgi:MFS family permease
MTMTGAASPLTRRGIPVDRDLRILALGSFANRFGSCAVMTTSALYFTRQVGFSPAQVALALSLSAIAGIVVQVPAGHLGDGRRRPTGHHPAPPKGGPAARRPAAPPVTEGPPRH